MVFPFNVSKVSVKINSQTPKHFELIFEEDDHKEQYMIGFSIYQILNELVLCVQKAKYPLYINSNIEYVNHIFTKPVSGKYAETISYLNENCVYVPLTSSLASSLTKRSTL